MIFERNKSLKTFNTFGFDQAAEYYCEPSSLEQVKEAIEYARHRKLQVCVLGGGSNIVLTRDIPGLTIRQRTNHISYEQKIQHTKVTCDAGVNWHELVRASIGKSLYGLENLSLIPGDVGAAPIQNIGAYGVEICEFIKSVSLLNISSGSVETISSNDCLFGYRDSVFKQAYRNRYIITGITLSLHNERVVNLSYAALAVELEKRRLETPDAESISEAVCSIRRSKLPDPAIIGNAGSFFKNPILPMDQFEALKRRYPDLPGHPLGNMHYKVSAAWLIERSGWKGRRMGDVGVHTAQALVLVHYGTANGEALLALADEVRKSVREGFQVSLEQEPVAI